MLRLIVLYTALSLCANAAAAADLTALKAGDMKKLIVYDQPLGTPELPFRDADGNEHRLAEFRGKVVLLNFWGVSCVPCRVEMPDLDALQAAKGGKDFEVLTLAVDTSSQPVIGRFFDKAGITHLPRYTDIRLGLASAFGIMGQPSTVLIDRSGHEVARLVGPADWNAPEAHAVIDALIAEAP